MHTRVRKRSPGLMTAVFGAAVLVAFGGSAALGWDDETPAQELYGKLGLPYDGSEVLAVMVTSSQLDGPLDVLYADLNCDGQFDDSEQVEVQTRPREVQTRPRTVGPVLIATLFKPLDLRVPQGDDEAPLPCKVAFRTSWYEDPERTPALTADVSLNLRTDEGDTWGYQAAGDVRLASRLGAAKKFGISGDPKMSVSTQPDKAKPGNTGIQVRVSWGTMTLSVKRRGGAPVFLEIKNAKGRVVHRGEADLADLGFG